MCSPTCSPYGALDGDIKTTALVYVWQIQRGPRFPRKHSSVQYRQWSRCCRRSVESEWVIMICGLHCCDMHWVLTEWIWHADIHINQFTHKGMDASADTDLDFLPCWIRNLKVKLISLVKLQGLSGCRSAYTPVCERAFVWTAASISLCLFNSHEAPGVRGRQLDQEVDQDNKCSEKDSTGGTSPFHRERLRWTHISQSNTPKCSNDFIKCVSRQVVFLSVNILWWDPWGETPLITSGMEAVLLYISYVILDRRSQRAGMDSNFWYWLFVNIYNNKEKVHRLIVVPNRAARPQVDFQRWLSLWGQSGSFDLVILIWGLHYSFY